MPVDDSTISLAGKSVLVTGASRGLGRLIAEFMAAQGCHLIVHSRQLDYLQSLLVSLRDKPVNVSPIAADLATLPGVESLLAQLQQQSLQVDVLFNNAGIQVPGRQDIYSTTASDFTSSFQVNCIAPALICYQLIPAMLSRGFGRIINVTSGIANEPQQAAYSASKAALDKFTQDLSSVLEGAGVLMNLVDPGWCKTDLGGEWAPNRPESALPGLIVGAFINDGISGRLFRAQDFAGLELTQAVELAERFHHEP